MNPPAATDEIFNPLQIVGCLDGTAAAELAMRGWLEMVEKGFGDGTIGIFPHMSAVIGYAQNGRDMLPVGVVVFFLDTSRVWVQQVYVLPEFRGRGIYTAMWSKLIQHVTETIPAARSIQLGTHVNNKVMRAIAARHGCLETFVSIRCDLQRPDGKAYIVQRRIPPER